ncbi:hypothetical protein GALMADRAFT_132735 [Galerina marginata CBS 339.88]|uniref:Uncharacterized protein n=1 Tax=Galerina marginata (strain CBS 339.88) TaxID=685588 RepID=A0A067TSE8_GALM3|nr:hypothetical protein GALMADRAFT_132735 [Galerina marginata CBS 339.88]
MAESILNKGLESASAISQLSNEILWEIFSVNADIGQETEKGPHALQTLRRTSQVCSTWRELALGSSSLWASIFDLNSLAQNRGEWRAEVFRRTGTAPLQIRAVFHNFFPKPLELFLEWTLNEHWDRIRNLDFRVSFSPLHQEKWHVFGRTAPSLQHFRFSWHNAPHYLSSTNFVLFANQAPELRSLSVKHMAVKLTTFSVAKLRKLVLHSPVPVSDLLTCLSRMTFLENLTSITSYQASNSNTQAFHRLPLASPLPQVSLPHLGDIKFLTGVEVNAHLSLLTHIIPASACTLDFAGAYNRELPDENTVDLCRHTLSAYSGRCQDLASTTHLQIHLSNHRFEFLSNFSSQRRFRFLVSGKMVHFSPQTVSTFLASFVTLPLNGITTLVLSVSFTEDILPGLYLVRFIHSLASVERLQTGAGTFSFLNNIQADNAVVLFPSLKRILVDGVMDHTDMSPVEDFIDLRTRRGISAEAFTLRLILKADCPSSQFERLKKIPGLVMEVIYFRNLLAGSLLD